MTKLEQQREMLAEFTGLFKDDNKQPLQFTPTQHQVIEEIVLMHHKRVSVITPTQYGKSTSTACGILIKGVLLPRKQVIIGGTKTKAAIIMHQVNKHVFDDDIFTSQLSIDGGALERLKRERRRDYLTFKRGGSITILTAENRNKKRLGEALLGEGGQDIYIDDSVLMDDDTYSYIKRMLGGHKDSFLMELANPLKRNHFYKTMHDKTTFKIWIDYKTAMDEGRFTQEFIEEMRKEMFFNVFYGCKFPEENEVDDNGYQRLLTDAEVDAAGAPVQLLPDRQNILGADVGRGGNKTILLIRCGNRAKIIFKAQTASVMDTPAQCIKAMQDWDIIASKVAIDDTGLGGGATDRMREQQYYVNAVVLGGKADKIDNSKIQYKNIRAQCYWELRNWVKGEGKHAGNQGCFEPDDDLVRQLKLIKYRIDSSGNIQIQPKEDMHLLTGESPDEADALALTFAPLAPEAAFSYDKKRNVTSYKNGAW